jgi:hypothetical protein
MSLKRYKPLRQDQSALIWASVATLLCWVVPIVKWVALPLEYLNAHTHEMCHALVAMATGGQVINIQVFADGSGVTPVLEPSRSGEALVAAAGYLGASIIGILLILFSRNAKGARNSLRILAGALTLSMILWVRGDAVGIISGIVWIAILFGLTYVKSEKAVLFGAVFVGVQQCLHSVIALFTLMQIAMFTERQNDAVLMAQATGLPAGLWAAGWALFSIGLMAITARGAFKN